jgi:hypothetical protein
MKAAEIVTLVILIASVSSFNLKTVVGKETHQVSPISTTSGVQGFADQVGSMFGSSQLNSLINFINSASTFYRDDYEQNLRFIQNSMTTSYGGSTNYYGVVIQRNSSYSYTGWNVYNAGGENFATLAPGVNRINPTWSYLVYSTYVQSYLNFAYIKAWGQGSGISA